MTYIVIIKQDLVELEEITEIKSEMKQLRLEEKLGKHGFQ